MLTLYLSPGMSGMASPINLIDDNLRWIEQVATFAKNTTQ